MGELVACPNCGTQISDEARLCPKCGGYMPARVKRAAQQRTLLITAAVVAVVIGVLFALS
jgi:predicted nucleic acid-binding Zn ribbon protein